MLTSGYIGLSILTLTEALPWIPSAMITGALTVENGRGDMGYRFGPGTGIERVGIRKERLSPHCFDRIHDPSNKDRPDGGGVSLFPEMKFYGYQIIGFDLVPNCHPLQKFTHLVQYRPFGIASKIGEKDRALFHEISSLKPRLGQKCSLIWP
jgi:hypothetical protein